jgi:hypothetical protein
MNDHNNPPKWQKFEKFVASIQKCLTPHAKVTHNDFISGKSGVKRQVDVAVRYNLGQFNLLVVIDCKDWKNPVDINDVGSFSDLVEDIGANKGAIVCNAGFTSGALKRAKEKGIDLLRAADAESKDWPVYMAIPMLCDFRYIEYSSYNIRHSAPTPFMIPGTDPRYLEIYNKDGELIDLITNLIKRAWNDKKLPDEPGEHRDLKFVENEVTGGFITHSITTSNIDVVDVEKNWRRLNSEDELAVKPAFVLVGSDLYPLIKTNK